MKNPDMLNKSRFVSMSLETFKNTT